MIRIGLHAVLLSTVMALPLVAGAAGPRQEVYYIGPTGGLYYADLVEILGHGKVRVARDTGAQTGKASITSLRKDILLDAPLSSFVDGQCADGNWAYQRRDVSRIVYQDSDKGTKPSSSTQWELGTLTNVDGCDIGHVEQFGDLNAPGTAMTHLNMGDNLPSMDGLFGTSRFGGLSDQPWPIDNAPEVDVVAFQSDRTLQFNRTGTTYPTLAVGRWLTFAAPDGEQRGYVRLALVKEWYAEIWLLARFQNGQIVRVLPRLMSKATANASFGSVKNMSRSWLYGVTVGTPYPMWIRLHEDGREQRVFTDENGLQYPESSPWSWVIAGPLIEQTRDQWYGGEMQRHKSWEPVATRPGLRWVIDRDWFVFADGHTDFWGPRRMQLFFDDGPPGDWLP
jgi:hypothetical protein